MRLSESEIVGGLRHSSVWVRDVVAVYLKDCYRTQPDMTREVIRAVEQFGWKEVLQFPHHVASFELDEATLPWALHQIERNGEDAPSENMRWHLAGMLAGAPIEVVRPYIEQILSLPGLNERRTRAPGFHRTNADLLKLRIELWDKSAVDCWSLLDEHCRAVADVATFAEADIRYAETLVERIASVGDVFAGEVLRILERIERPENGYEEWLVGMMIQLAGEMRLEGAAEFIYRQFAQDWDWFNEQIMDALVKIGTPSVTALVCERYVGGPDHVRIYSNGILDSVHHDDSIADTLKLIPHEDDEGLRGQLGVALASHFDQRGIEPALELYYEEPDDPERFEIIERLYTHACLADLDIPEKEQWDEWIEARWKRFNKNRGNLDSLLESIFLDANDGDAEEWENNEFFSDQTRRPEPPLHEIDHFSAPQTIVRDATHVGRNEPCPCGSGKKYKKCCLRSELS